MSARLADLPVSKLPAARQSDPSPQSGKQPSKGHKHKKQANSKKKAADTIRLQYEEGSSE